MHFKSPHKLHRRWYGGFTGSFIIFVLIFPQCAAVLEKFAWFEHVGKQNTQKKTGHSSMHADCIWLLENWGNYINGSNWIRNIPSGWSRTEWSARDFLEHELIPPKFIGIFIVQRRCRDFDQIEQTNVGILECIYQLKAWRQK